jgi:hypothetical protein
MIKEEADRSSALSVGLFSAGMRWRSFPGFRIRQTVAVIVSALVLKNKNRVTEFGRQSIDGLDLSE